MIVLLKRAALIAALSFSTAAFAQLNSPARESAKDIVEKAQNLLLQRDRQQALHILSGAIRREKQKPQLQELVTALDGVATYFLSDRSQQTYEAAISLRRSDIVQAQQRLQEALLMEPDNLLLVVENARLSIARRECKQAIQLLRAWKTKFADHALLTLTQAQAEACLVNLEPTGLKQAILFAKTNTEFTLFWWSIVADISVSTNDQGRLKEAHSYLAKNHPDYPEIDYWAAQLESKNSKKSTILKKYLMTCKNISAATFRRYMIDPMICRRVAEDEADQKVPHATNQ